MSSEGRFRGVGSFTEAVARRIGVEPESDHSPSEAAEYRRCMDRMIELRDRFPWLRGRHAFVQAASLWLSFTIEKTRKTLAGRIRQIRGEADDG